MSLIVSIDSLFSSLDVSSLSKKKEWKDIVRFNVRLPIGHVIMLLQVD
jgi:hypothetical protein